MAHRVPAVPAGGFQHIAILRLSSLGDIVLTQPAVQALARAYPRARISYWVKEEFADLVRFDPAIAHVRVLERDARRLEDLMSMSAELEEADLIVDLHANLRTQVLTFRQAAPVLRTPAYRVARWMRVHARWAGRPAPPAVLARHALALAPLGIVADGPPRVHAGDGAEAWAKAWLAAWGPAGAPVAMVPGAAHATKRWPEAHWLELHERLRAAGRPLVYFGLEADRARVPALHAKAALDPGCRWCMEPLPRVAALLSHCSCAVTGDTGLMHLAAARGLRVVAMFGSTAPELGFAPAGDGHAVLCRHEACQPCTLHGRAACPKRHFRCMVELKAEQVATEVQHVGGGA
jgi:ADP-heptose:LPS heptosyltransferase